MVTYMEKLIVERKNAAKVFTILANQTPPDRTVMSEAKSLVQELEYLDRELARYNGKQPLLSRRTKTKV